MARKLLTVAAASMIVTCAAALADTAVAPLGLYLGGATGRANVRDGGGVQFKISRVAIRAEYERISARGGDPSLLSAGAIWTF